MNRIGLFMTIISLPITRSSMFNRRDRLGPALAFCLLAIVLIRAARGDDASENRLTVQGVCSIGTPGKGWTWKAVKEYDAQKGGTYVCSAQAAPGKVFLTIDSRKLTSNEDRIATLKSHFNTLHQALEKLGCTDIKGKRPELKTPVPPDVDYFVFGKTPKGATVYLAAHTLFQEHSYLVQAVAPSLETAQKLAQTAGSLREGN